MNKLLHILAALLLPLPLIVLAMAWSSLPEIIPTHFGIEGNPDQYGPKRTLALVQLLLTVVNAGVYLLLTNTYRIDPKKFASENKGRMQKMAIAITLFIVLVQLWILYITRNGESGSVNLIFIGVGLLFAIMGNYMHHIRPNYFAGFRVPWTLENPENWRKTHQMAGRIWFMGGLVIALGSFLLPFRASFILLIAVSIIIVLIPGVYSYRLYKRHNP